MTSLGAGLAPHAEPTSVPNQRLVLGTLLTTATAFSLLQTMVVPALPVLKRELHTTTTWVAWIATGYLLSAAVTMPILSKLGDQYGRGRVLKLVLTVFALSSLGAGFAPNIGSLIVLRAIQGIGATIMPLSFGVIRDLFPKEKVAGSIGMITSTLGIGSGAGLVVAGVIVDHLSWRWLFLLPGIVIAVARILVGRCIPSQNEDAGAPAQLDIRGAAILTTTLLAFLLALTEGSRWGWSSPRLLGLFAVAALGIPTFIGAERRASEPLMDTRLFARRPVMLTNGVAFFLGTANLSLFILIPTFAETPRGVSEPLKRLVHYGFDASPTKAGLLMLPLAVTMLAGGTLAARIGARLGSMKWPLAFGCFSLCLTASGLSVWHRHPWEIAVMSPLIGLGFGLAYASLGALSTESVPMQDTSVAVSMMMVSRAIGSQAGAQIGAALLASIVIAGTAIPTEGAFDLAFAVSAVGALIGACTAMFVTPGLRRSNRPRE